MLPCWHCNVRNSRHEEMSEMPNNVTHDSFATRSQGGGRSPYCRACQKEYCKAHYRRFGHAHNIRRYANQKRYRKRNATKLWEYLSEQTCVDCGESDKRVLEFDHVRGDKIESVGVLCAQGISWRRVVAEIAKCDVRCANCHRRRTARQFGWRRGLGA